MAIEGRAMASADLIRLNHILDKLGSLAFRKHGFPEEFLPNNFA